MRDCRKILARMSEHLDGELPLELCRVLERHLADCPDCQVMYDSLNKTIRVFRAGTEEPLPEDLKDRLHRALETRWAGRRRR